MSPMCRAAAIFAALLLAGPGFTPVARADAGWLESGDVALRMDLQLLNDADVIRLPVNTWPIPRAAVEYALSNAKPHFAVNGAVSAALERVRARVERRATTRLGAWVSGGDAGVGSDDQLRSAPDPLGDLRHHDGRLVIP